MWLQLTSPYFNWDTLRWVVFGGGGVLPGQQQYMWFLKWQSLSVNMIPGFLAVPLVSDMLVLPTQTSIILNVIIQGQHLLTICFVKSATRLWEPSTHLCCNIDSIKAFKGIYRQLIKVVAIISFAWKPHSSVYHVITLAEWYNAVVLFSKDCVSFQALRKKRTIC